MERQSLKKMSNYMPQSQMVRGTSSRAHVSCHRPEWLGQGVATGLYIATLYENEERFGSDFGWERAEMNYWSLGLKKECEETSRFGRCGGEDWRVTE